MTRHDRAIAAPEKAPAFVEYSVLVEIAFAAQLLTVLAGMLHNNALGMSSVMFGLLGVVLLAQVRKRASWAWWAFVTVQSVGFAVIALALVTRLAVPYLHVDVSWVTIILSAIALVAVLWPPVRVEMLANR
ncbi:hypothetical protein EYE40_07400 [Glaciihabitans arcticus]|uniref:Uncharacterized protein n=1 Tax=Glaciihabitans arcticus TaxID=2668039 RepID=A0A4Q9GVL0_9MICO|nr:hypothetical protein [Glaciihabitans arcticus]TBN57237.1 hypothetical protein EYE40_07400 [Glaciihabitans arcticus]